VSAPKDSLIHCNANA